jgi:hypothetical protein
MKKKQAMPVLAGTAHFQFEQKLLLQQFGFKALCASWLGFFFSVAQQEVIHKNVGKCQSACIHISNSLHSYGSLAALRQ